jgi:septum formation protein
MMKKQDGQTTSLTAVGKTKVVFERLTKAQIEKYVASGSPMDKAGAYGIQDGGLVKKIKGSFSNVVGLPVELCKAMIDRIKQED